jgi:hypothetical protein
LAPGRFAFWCVESRRKASGQRVFVRVHSSSPTSVARLVRARSSGKACEADPLACQKGLQPAQTPLPVQLVSDECVFAPSGSCVSAILGRLGREDQ